MLVLLLLAVPAAATFVVVTALAAPLVEDPGWRLAVGVAAVLVPALLLRCRLRRRLRWLLLGANTIVTAGLALGFADDVGRALRRHGDWFIGERNGLVARATRRVVAGAAGWLERFDPLEPTLPEAPAAPGTEVAWRHPLAGPRRVLPGNESQRFGAARPQPRPPECELGHCGVDLVGPIGTPVHAIGDGVVDRIERDPDRDPVSGIYIILAHGALRSRYIHLDGVAAELKVGDRIAAGQVIGSLGRTGVRESAPHLHFGLSRLDAGHERFIDPQPYLAIWPLPEPVVASR